MLWNQKNKYRNNYKNKEKEKNNYNKVEIKHLKKQV